MTKTSTETSHAGENTVEISHMMFEAFSVFKIFFPELQALAPWTEAPVCDDNSYVM